ncbi:arsenical pump-driving ATPase [Ramlibacter tataouinensis]|uniref:arsenical pump-driving ATPase n=1 Tax=Ramlibacter tataouinensis TaxID=94132 RepID=UPI0022F3F4EC|nr:arsenical pump-driving ATPase [Ramlibacter tataouinensis]WBY01743.1 arsenical pump-driving ATPase [Ramlibacter tataouinensis]
MQNEPLSLSVLKAPPAFLFFTGKGGVGKTSLACACALALTESGKRVLLVSTDPASNLDEMLRTTLSDEPRPVSDAPNLFAMNIDPDVAAQRYRSRVLSQMAPSSPESEREKVREQLSGACTTEIAAFDEFVGLLAGNARDYDHVVFDTAPTGHTLRLLSLPQAWAGFLAGNDRGASCLGPHSGLKMQEDRFRAGLAALGDPAQTAIVLVTRADRAALREAERTHGELLALGLANQRLVVNAVFWASVADDQVAVALQRTGEEAMAAMPETLRALPQDQVPLRPFDMVGLPALRALLKPHAPALDSPLASPPSTDVPPLRELAEELATKERGLIMVMGKGGVGKTTIAAALALELARRGKTVHLSTTDPAAHLASTLEGQMPGLEVSRIDPKVETDRYIAKVMSSRAAELDNAERALLLEDLQSPCTEEVAVFHAFSRTVNEATSAFVVLDTAPTGHTLLLMDATGAYHRQMVSSMEKRGAVPRFVTPLMRLQDPEYTRIVLVALPEVTPVSEAASLQEDLRRARIEPFAWVVNRSLASCGSRDPVLSSRIAREQEQIQRVKGLAKRTYLVPWFARPPVGLGPLLELAGHHD